MDMDDTLILEEQAQSMCCSEHSSTSSFEAIDESIHSSMLEDVNLMSDDIQTPPPDDSDSPTPSPTEPGYDTYMTDSVESNLTVFSSETSNNFQLPPFVILAICALFLMLLSSAKVSPSKDCDAVMVEVKQFVNKLREENVAFKQQLIWEVKQNLFKNLTNQINDLKSENEVLKQLLHQKTTEIVTKLPIANFSKDKDAGQSSKPRGQPAAKKIVIQVVKIIFAFILAVLLFEWIYQFSNGKSGLMAVLDALNSFKKQNMNVWTNSKVA